MARVRAHDDPRAPQGTGAIASGEARKAAVENRQGRRPARRGRRRRRRQGDRPRRPSGRTAGRDDRAPPAPRRWDAAPLHYGSSARRRLRRIAGAKVAGRSESCARGLCPDRRFAALQRIRRGADRPASPMCGRCCARSAASSPTTPAPLFAPVGRMLRQPGHRSAAARRRRRRASGGIIRALRQRL